MFRWSTIGIERFGEIKAPQLWIQVVEEVGWLERVPLV